MNNEEKIIGMLENLTCTVGHLSSTVNQFSSRVDQLTAKVDQLTDDVSGFKTKKQKQIKLRLDALELLLSTLESKVDKVSNVGKVNSFDIHSLKMAK